MDSFSQFAQNLTGPGTVASSLSAADRLEGKSAPCESLETTDVRVRARLVHAIVPMIHHYQNEQRQRDHVIRNHRHRRRHHHHHQQQHVMVTTAIQRHHSPLSSSLTY